MAKGVTFVGLPSFKDLLFIMHVASAYRLYRYLAIIIIKPNGFIILEVIFQAPYLIKL